MLHDKLWLTLAAWFGILFLPALFASLWVPDAVERLRARNARILDEREARRG